MTLVERFWSKFCQKNPGFSQGDDTKVTMTIGQVRKIVKQAHRDGFAEGMRTAKSVEGLGAEPSVNSLQSILDILKKKGQAE